MKCLIIIYILYFILNISINSSAYKILHHRSNKITVNNQIKNKIKVQLTNFPDSTILPLFEQSLLVNIPLGLLISTTTQKSLTKEGLLHAGVLGIGLWTFLGYKGWLLCVGYLILGSIVTKVKMLEKEKLGIAEKRGGARGPENVWGAAATGMLCSLLTYIYPQYSTILTIGYVASLATKLSDTVASEIGKAYGKTTYLITTLKLVPKGTEGAISLEGTVAGIIGSIVLTFLAIILGLISNTPINIIACIIAAFVATTIESFIGATYQDNVKWLTNELVNFINTLIGAIVAITIVSIF